VRFVRVAVVVGGLALAAGCGSSGATTKAGKADVTAPRSGSATISTFDVPAGAVQCYGKTSVVVHVRYGTAHAAAVQLFVDGAPVPNLAAPSGDLDVPIHCDPLPHTFVMVAKDKEARPTTVRKIVITAL
jgi:hypothetical protein